MPSSPSDKTSALAVQPAPQPPAVDGGRRVTEISFSPMEAAPGEKAAQIDLSSVEVRATEYADGTRVRSWTRTQQHIEVVAPEQNSVSIAQVAEHAPVLNALAGSSETARLLKLDNDDDYTDDDFDDDDDDLEDDDHDDDDDDDDGDDFDDDAGEEREARPRRAESAAPSLPASTSWNPPFTTIRHGNITVTVPDIGAIVAQLGELLSNTQRHQKIAREALQKVEPLAQKAMNLGYSSASPEAVDALRDEAKKLASTLAQAEEARSLAASELAHGQRISQRATGSPRVKEKLDALTAAASETQEAAAEASRLLRAIEGLAP